MPRRSSTTASKELGTAVVDFDDYRNPLEATGLTLVRYQENYQEEWDLDGVICDLDESPGLPPFIEIACADSDAVHAAGPPKPSCRYATGPIHIYHDLVTLGTLATQWTDKARVNQSVRPDGRLR
jgi:hypothetical protein